jgi:hypothetical protein
LGAEWAVLAEVATRVVMGRGEVCDEVDDGVLWCANRSGNGQGARSVISQEHHDGDDDDSA